jgi:hypothetical protein
MDGMSNDTVSNKSAKWDHHYSGSNSIEFWKRVNKIPLYQGGETLYALGCELQNFEERVLQRLRDAEDKRKKTTGAK